MGYIEIESSDKTKTPILVNLDLVSSITYLVPVKEADKYVSSLQIRVEGETMNFKIEAETVEQLDQKLKTCYYKIYNAIKKYQGKIEKVNS